MDERRVRSTTGRMGDGTIHRVGLTRHCLASGSIQLPFALRDALPGGELLAHDVERDENVTLASIPPRRLSGLREFFAVHELQVNDLLEIRASGAELRLACIRSARTVREPEAAAAVGETAPSAPSARPSVPPPPRGDDPRHGAATDDHAVVDRIGSVTVRRLGARTFLPPPETSLRRGAAPADPRIATDAGASGGPAGDDAADVRAGDAGVAAARTTGATAGEPSPALPVVGGEVSERAPSAPARPPGARQERLFADAVEAELEDADATERATVREVARDPAPAIAYAEVHETDLRDEPVSRPVRAGREASRLPWLRRATAPEDRESDGARGDRQAAPAAVKLAAKAAGEPGPRTVAKAGANPATRTPSSAPRPERSPSRAEPRERTATGEETRGREGRRAREEALSRAGDLRSRIIRWLLDPATPVIVQYEVVQERFDLQADVARDVLAGILESPPPSLRLTVLREGMIRVSRVTVVHEV